MKNKKEVYKHLLKTIIENNVEGVVNILNERARLFTEVNDKNDLLILFKGLLTSNQEIVDILFEFAARENLLQEKKDILLNNFIDLFLESENYFYEDYYLIEDFAYAFRKFIELDSKIKPASLLSTYLHNFELFKLLIENYHDMNSEEISKIFLLACADKNSSYKAEFLINSGVNINSTLKINIKIQPLSRLPLIIII